jgi:hypothetical protein
MGTTLDTVEVPVKADSRVMDAIWRYYSSRIRYKGAVDKAGPIHDQCQAECWGALMAYQAIVEEFSK